MSLQLKTDFRGSPPRPFKRNGVYYIRLTTGRRDIWRSCKTTNRGEAERYSYEVWFQHQKEGAKALLKEPIVSVADIFKQYKETENFKNLKPSTARTRIINANAFSNYAENHRIITFDELTPEFCESFLNTRGRTGKTFNNVRSDLVQIFAQIAKQQASENPFEKVPQRSTTRGETASRPKAAFTDEQIQRILEYIRTGTMRNRDEWFRACKIAMYTGLRYEDIALLKYEDITDDILELTPKKTEKVVLKKIIIRIPDELRPEIFPPLQFRGKYVLPGLAATYPQYNRDGILIGGSKEPLKPFGDVLKKLSIFAPAGYTIGFHSFRVTLVTKLRQAGYSAEVIGGIVGHTSAVQTEHYNRAALSIDVSKIHYNEVNSL